MKLFYLCFLNELENDGKLKELLKYVNGGCYLPKDLTITFSERKYFFNSACAMRVDLSIFSNYDIFKSSH